MSEKIQKLTKAEEEIMQIIWKLEKAFLKDIMAEVNKDKDKDKEMKQSTVSTMVRLLMDKEFVSYEAFGKSYRYYPLIPKSAYAKFYFDNFLGRYFDGSFKRLLSFFHAEGELRLEDVNQIMESLEDSDDQAAQS
ncbi:MAG: BlaI/MecI/CopY family transcriptional regulator [Bacteroidota bacterium]